MTRRVLVILAMAVFGLLFAAAPAQALPNPIDCKGDPQITTPLTGAPGWLDAGPTHPRTGDPFAKDAKVSAYEVYGWGGLSWPNYDMGCGPDAVRDPSSTGAGVIANFMWGSLVTACAGVTALLRWAFSPSTLAVFDPIMQLTGHAFGSAVFMPLFFITVCATGVYIMARSGKGDVRTAAHSAGWVTLITLAALAAITWPTTIAPIADRTVTGIVSTVSASVAGDRSGTTNLTLGDAVAANLEHGILFETWKAGQFGRSNGAVADKYGPALFKAAALTRAEAAQIEKDPSKADGIYETHKNAYQDVASKIKDEDPQAYEYLAGHRNNERAISAALGWIGFWCSALYLAVAGLITMFSLTVLRLAIVALPLLALVGAFPPARKLILGVFDYVVGALACAVLFGCFSVGMAAALGGLMSPASSVHPALAALLMVVLSVAAWFLSKPIRRIKSFANLRAHARNLTRDGGEQPGQTAPNGWNGEEAPARAPGSATSAPSGRAPAEATSRVVGRAALSGAVQGAIGGLAAGAVTGGGATVGAAAAGAARGAAVAGAGVGAAQITGSGAAGAVAATAAGRAIAHEPAHVAPADARALPAGTAPAAHARTAAAESAAPAQPTAPAQPSVKLYEPGKESPADHLTPAPARMHDGQLVYDLYTPAGSGA